MIFKGYPRAKLRAHFHFIKNKEIKIKVFHLRINICQIFHIAGYLKVDQSTNNAVTSARESTRNG